MPIVVSFRSEGSFAVADDGGHGSGVIAFDGLGIGVRVVFPIGILGGALPEIFDPPRTFGANRPVPVDLVGLRRRRDVVLGIDRGDGLDLVLDDPLQVLLVDDRGGCCGLAQGNPRVDPARSLKEPLDLVLGCRASGRGAAPAYSTRVLLMLVVKLMIRVASTTRFFARPRGPLRLCAARSRAYTCIFASCSLVSRLGAEHVHPVADREIVPSGAIPASVGFKALPVTATAFPLELSCVCVEIRGFPERGSPWPAVEPRRRRCRRWGWRHDT